MARVLTGSLLVALLAPAVVAAPAAAERGTPECGDTETLAGAPDLMRTLAAGILLRSWNSAVAEVDVVSAEPRTAALRVWTAPAGTVQKVRTTLEVDSDAVAAVNGDFFRRSPLGSMPVSDVVVGGQAKYLVPGWVPALTVDPRGAMHATSVHADATVTFRWSDVVKKTVVKSVGGKTVRVTVTTKVARVRALRLTSMNTSGKLGPDSAVLYTRTWPTSAPAPKHIRVLRTSTRATSSATQPPTSAVASPARPWLALGKKAAARLSGVPRSAVATVTWDIAARDGSTVRDSVGRGAVLLRDGRVITDCSGDDRPRTAIGWDDRGRTWIITAQEGDRIDVIGGARMGGTTNFQMAQWLHQLGATEGVTLDGGGSTDLEVRTSAGLHRADLPDNAFARLVPNGLIMVPKG
ncbi:MAG: phosphodiester glycosidase family protein [Candidatus Nanopelagicales bacterium]